MQKWAVWHQSRKNHLSLPPSKQLFIWLHTHLKFPEWTGTPNWVLCQKDVFCLPFLTYAALQGNAEGGEAVLPHHIAMSTGRNKVRGKTNRETMSFWGLVSALLWTVWFLLLCSSLVKVMSTGKLWSLSDKSLTFLLLGPGGFLGMALY